MGNKSSKITTPVVKPKNGASSRISSSPPTETKDKHHVTKPCVSPTLRTPNVRKDVRFRLDSASNGTRSSLPDQKRRSKEHLGRKLYDATLENPIQPGNRQAAKLAPKMAKSKKEHYYLSSLSLSKGLLTGVTRGQEDSRGTIIFVFFLAYFTSRYAAWLATKQVYEVSARRTFDIASAVFIVSSVWGVAANRQAAYLPDQGLKTPTRDILWTSALVASGAFAGSCSITTIISGVLCGLWTTKLTSLNVNINKCAGYGVHLIGGIVGGVATGNVVTDSNVSIGVAHGIILGVVVSIVVSELGANITIILEGFVNTCMADLSPATVVGVTVGVGGGLASWIVNGFIKGMIIGFPSGFVGTLVAVVLVLMMATYFVENNKHVQN